MSFTERFKTGGCLLIDPVIKVWGGRANRDRVTVENIPQLFASLTSAKLSAADIINNQLTRCFLLSRRSRGDSKIRRQVKISIRKFCYLY